ncbi:MAG TPA: UDP-N-acetylmuramoyl-tripeptide--D-alanyl-D-alanine ligase [Smithellaceae bacterium]|nr:UDP-N-acetylmuramoyl-tripeptide--D-alanyl-D-alanine ligase [Smithellaceae bacterium]
MTTGAPVFSVDEILSACGGRLVSGRGEDRLSGVSTDTRAIEKGNLFVALKGDRFDAHDFLTQAVDQGARALVVAEDRAALAPSAPGIAVVAVPDTLRALGDLAHAHRMKFHPTVIGLTGSSGKTTTKEMLAAILSAGKNVLKTEGNLNNLIGVPKTLLRLSGGHDLAIVEMGTNTPGEIARLTAITDPDIGLITNVGPAHLAGFGSLDAVREEKGSLFMNLRPSACAVVNIDDEAIRVIAQRWPGRQVTFGMGADADVGAKNIQKRGVRGVRFELVMGGSELTVEMKITGIHHIYNAMAAAAAAWAAGVDPEGVRSGLAAFSPVAGRMDMIELACGAYLIDDSYNANPASVREALLALKDLKDGHRAYVVLGDMLELGEAAVDLHRRIGRIVATIGVTAVLLRGDFAGDIAAGAREGGMSEDQIIVFDHEEEALRLLASRVQKGDWILVKGSRAMKMDRVAAVIREHFGTGPVS